MSSYPLISHRLYIAAIGSAGLHAKPGSNQTAFASPGPAHAIPLELMDNARPLAAPDVRRLQAAPPRAQA